MRDRRVAPRAGAWIETLTPRCSARRGASLPARGAWIETLPGLRTSRLRVSLPARERGLKQLAVTHERSVNCVAPRAGAWIETSLSALQEFGASLPARERGLKQSYAHGSDSGSMCRSPRGSVD